jgi:hypothetical protein
VREYRLARLPRLVWVVEAVDRRRRQRGEPCVLGEAVFDSTSTDYDSHELIVRVPGACLVVQTDGTMSFPLPAMRRPCRSGRANREEISLVADHDRQAVQAVGSCQA